MRFTLFQCKGEIGHQHEDNDGGDDKDEGVNSDHDSSKKLCIMIITIMIHTPHNFLAGCASSVFQTLTLFPTKLCDIFGTPF